MKKLYMMLTALLAAVTFASCSMDADPFLTAGEDDDPRILNTELAESKGGEPIALPNITRDANFNMEAIVTPREYTTVTWFVDGELVHTGNEIDYALIAGDYSVKIVATTTKGKSTYRDCTLKVLPAAGDPAIDEGAVARHMMPGKEKTVDGSNLDGIVKVYINGVECTGVKVDGDKLTFTVPNLEEGTYKMVVEKADGMKYGCGNVIISNEAYVEGEKETTLWEGSFDVTWGSAFDAVKELTLAMANDGRLYPGVKLRAYVKNNGSAEPEPAQGSIASSWWRNLLTDGADGDRGDVVIEGEQVIEVELTEFAVNLIKEQSGILVVGNGYTITKFTMVEVVAGATTLWEGEHELTWGTPFDALKEQAKGLFEAGTLAEGKTVKVTCTYTPRDEAGKIAITSAWWNNILTGLDGEGNRGDIVITEGGEHVVEFTLTDKSADKVATEDGLLIVGDGLKITKVVVE